MQYNVQSGMIIFNYKGVYITMVKVYTRRVLINLLWVMILVALTSCNKENKAENRNISELQGFSIIDGKVDSVTKMVIHELYPEEKRTEETMVLELNDLNDTLEMVYSFHKDKERLNRRFISLANKRVLGYTKYGEINILLLTNINYFDKVVSKLSPIIKPLKGQTQKNDFVIHDCEQYSHWDDGFMYEPLCWHFKYKDGVVSNPSGYLGY